MIRLQLPAPPSVNKSMLNARTGRVMHPNVRAWRKTCAWMIKAAGQGRIDGRVAVAINVERINAHADIDNRVKLLLDLLVRERVIDDDRHVVAVSAAWSTEARRHAEPTAEIIVLPAPPAGAPIPFVLYPTAPGVRGGWFIPAPEPTSENHGD